MAKDLTRLNGALHTWRQLNETIKDFEERRDHLRQIIIDELGDDDNGTIDGETVVTYKWQKTTRIDTKTLKEQQPDLCKKYERVSEHRRFVVVSPESVDW
jgi:predicted phage-related endonuclease